LHRLIGIQLGKKFDTTDELLTVSLIKRSGHAGVATSVATMTDDAIHQSQLLFP
jgi:hypothetical protein